MAVRKEKIKEQFQAAFDAAARARRDSDRGQPHAIGTATPWLAGAIGILVMYLAGMRFYSVVVTDRGVLFMKMSQFSQRPKGLAWADQRSAVSIADVDANAKLWSHFSYRKPDGKAIRLNFNRIWRDELQG